jgi:hypothetical protein
VVRKDSVKELIARAGEGGTPVQKLPDAGRILDSSKLADVFGTDFGGVDASAAPQYAIDRKGGGPAAHPKSKYVTWRRWREWLRRFQSSLDFVRSFKPGASIRRPVPWP